MKNSTLSIKNIVAIGIGSALFLILGRFASIPTGIPNTNFELVYVFLAIMALIYGPISGFLIGLIGHTLKDVLFYGFPWFSWIVASAIFGLVIGIFSKRINLENLTKKDLIKFNIAQILANIISWVLVAPLLDKLIYSEPLNKVVTQGIVASFTNIITIGIIGTSLVVLYSKTRVKKGSLSKES